MLRRERVLVYRRKTRERALAALGGRCAVCGEGDPDVLEIDHIEPIGRDPKKKIGDQRQTDWRRAANGDTTNLQALRANDHRRKTLREQRVV